MKKLLFLDRDGVINRFPGKGKYVVRPEDFEFLPKALDAIRLLTESGYEIHVVSNQGCVAREMITRDELQTLTDRMLADVRQAGGDIKGVHYCYHRKADNCVCKKPKTFLFKKAAGEGVNWSDIAFVGDSEEDIQAGKALGCTAVLVLSGRNKEEDIPALAEKPDVVKKDLWEAAQWLTAKKS